MLDQGIQTEREELKWKLKIYSQNENNTKG